MNEEEVENRIDEIRDELQAYKRQLDSLEEDLKLLIKHSTTAQRDIIATANPVDDRDSDRLEVHRCREFLEKYDIRL
jgi:prefoldin subunit 5